MGGALAGVVGVAGFTAFSSKLLEVADRLDKVAIQTGLTVEQLQALQFASSQSGVSSETFNASMNKFNRILGEANSGIPKAQEAYKKLGIQIKDDEGGLKSSATLLLEVADAFSLIEEPADKAKTATDLFGRAGIDLIPMLQNGSRDILNFENTLVNAGGIIEKTATQDIAKFNDSLDLLSRVTLANFSKILVPLLPALTTIAGSFGDIAKVVGIAGTAFLTAKIPAMLLAITAGVKGLTIALASNPIGLIATGIATIGTTYIAYKEDIDNFFGIGDKGKNLDKTAESIEKLNTQLSDTGFETQFASTATNTFANQTTQLDGQTKKVIKSLKSASEEMEKVTKHQDTNLMLVAHTAEMIDEKGAPAMFKLQDAISKIDEQASQGAITTEFLATGFNNMFLNMALTTENWGQYIGGRFDFILDQTVGVEFFNALDFIFLTKLRDVAKTFDDLVGKMLALMFEMRQGLVDGFDGMLFDMQQRIDDNTKPGYGGIITSWDLLLIDMVEKLKTTQTLIPKIDSSDLVTASRRITEIVNQVDGVKRSVHRTYNAKYDNTGNKDNQGRSLYTQKPNEFWEFSATSLSEGAPNVSRTGSRMPSPASMNASEGSSSSIQINIFDGTGKAISEYDTNLRIEVKDVTSRQGTLPPILIS
tara:strand:- start:1933 stop:3879 length:1947 start_codon:yes stop_codon:yes gene_type:complete